MPAGAASNRRCSGGRRGGRGHNLLLVGLDTPCLRRIEVTLGMHRVHHSVERIETDSNFGFNLPCWEWLFGTCRDQPRAGQDH
ncbi:sterol desaturase/sphingolipid hydroxylase (fatty acid hydroxylase superfamily) [Methylohalomonas lacus]|uniref:Sterol desaturase/sphingolipid hydroxylase (Fatty acid hydroxylase superfamily) n=1 Tax=Methylohalomonas lacus TaxID=398773 RepID=A0AAE3HLP1_9GAMM|nr:hypothetical protein [Methylohalomonas lacus]MCS3903419.1 sterol desaturase/sphingolipid hydroxylase (fatty acid hydroxylase superfamily) [Methylohalomonas lacus]